MEMNASSKIEITLEEFSEICRTCFSGNDLRPISDVYLEDDLSVEYAFQQWLTINVEEKTYLPQNICTKCVEVLQAFNKFRLDCISNDAMLKQMLLDKIETESCVSADEIIILKDETILNVQDDDADIEQTANENSTKQFYTLKPSADEESNTQDAKIQQIDGIKCSKCKRMLPIEHYKSHSCKPRKNHPCPMCGRLFYLKGNLYRHIRIHTGEKPYICSKCGKAFNQTSVLKEHEETVHNPSSYCRPYKCKLCPRVFERYTPYILHVTRIHAKSDDQFVQDMKQLEVERFHTRPKLYQCAVCGKQFHTSPALTQHSRFHNDVRDCPCPYCGKLFSNRAYMKHHINTHSNELPFSCDICNKRFKAKSSLGKHIILHTADKPYECPYCSMSFKQSSHRTAHIRTHTGEKPHKCSYCDRAFALKSNLTVHERLHTEKSK